jgi:hypothetical protein
MTTQAPPPAAGAAPARTWEDWATRTTAILAVLAALSSGQWGASNLKAILEQGKVNDGWAFYQSKSIKEHLAGDSAELAAALAVDRPGAGLADLEKARRAERSRLAVEKQRLRDEVEAAEKRRDLIVERSFWFEMAFALLQVGVVLSTIGTAAKKKAIWVAAVLAGLLGLTLVANGFLRVVKAPAYARNLGLDLELKDPTQSPAPAPGSK